MWVGKKEEEAPATTAVPVYRPSIRIYILMGSGGAEGRGGGESWGGRERTDRGWGSGRGRREDQGMRSNNADVRDKSSFIFLLPVGLSGTTVLRPQLRLLQGSPCHSFDFRWGMGMDGLQTGRKLVGRHRDLNPDLLHEYCLILQMGQR